MLKSEIKNIRINKATHQRFYDLLKKENEKVTHRIYPNEFLNQLLDILEQKRKHE